MKDSVFLVIESAVVIDGQIASKGALVEVTDTEARNLLARGKARVATEADGAPDAEPAADTAGQGEAETKPADKPAKGRK